MESISLILGCCSTFLDTTTLHQLRIVCTGILCMSDRVTLLGISRWTEKGGSYRTLQRFFKKAIPWCSLNWMLIKSMLTKDGVILIGGDATTVTKSGKETYGVGRFFSSIYSRAVPGISFQVLSLIDVTRKKSSPILIEQILPKPKKAKSKTKNNKKTEKRKRGRPKGSKNKNKSEVVLNAEMQQVSGMLQKVMAMIGKTIKPFYFVYDGAFGNNAAAQMTLQAGLHLISKFRNDSQLYFQWTGNYSGKGKRKIYGGRIDYQNIPDQYLKSKSQDGNIVTEIYQIIALHKKFSSLVNVVVIVKKNIQSNKVSHAILFTTDLKLGHAEICEYYSLRFQIEFNFRDAKQYWGLEDFMVTEQQAVCNSANIAFLMVNLTQALLPISNAESIHDLKAHYRAVKYAKEILKLLPKKPQAINTQAILDGISLFGRVHDVKIAA